MTILKIKDWDKHFENNRTRELKKLSWVPFPNKHDGDGYTELLDHTNGTAHFGVWVLIVQVASKCDPRGTLLRDGGKPHDYASLSRMTRIPGEILKEAIDRLLNIEWLESYDNLAPSCDAKTAEGCRLPEGNGMEGKGKKEEEAPPPAPVQNRFSEAIQKLRTGHIAFKTVPDVSIENALKSWPEQKWHEAIESLCHRYAGAHIPRPIPTLENHLSGKSKNTPVQKQDNKKSYNQARNEIVTKLEEAKAAGGDSVSRCLSVCNDLYRDTPKQEGVKVVDNAYEIFKFRNKN